MSLTFDLVINPVVLFVSVMGGAILGYGLGRGKLARSEAKLRKLETELLFSHEETLESQKAFVALEARLNDQAIPVIPMKIGGNKENPKEKASK